MNYIFCDNTKCCRELKEIDTLLDAKCSDICKVITKLEKERYSVCTGEVVGFITGGVSVIVIARALVHASVVLGLGSLCIFGPILIYICVLIGGRVDKTSARNRGIDLGAIDRAIEKLREFKKKFEQIHDKLRLSELYETVQLCRYIREYKNTHAHAFLRVEERDSKTVWITVTAEAETRRSKDGTVEFRILGREKAFIIAKDFCKKIFPDSDTCDFSWLNNTTKQSLCSVECISEKVDGFMNMEPVKMLEMKLDDQSLCEI